MDSFPCPHVLGVSQGYGKREFGDSISGVLPLSPGATADPDLIGPLDRKLWFLHQHPHFSTLHASHVWPQAKSCEDNNSILLSCGHGLSSGPCLLLYTPQCLQVTVGFVWYSQLIVIICRWAGLVGSYSAITLHEHNFSHQVYARQGYPQFPIMTF